MVSTTPFSSVLHQLLSTSKPTSKGKGKGKSKPTDFLTTSTPNDNNDLTETVSAFIHLVEKYEKQSTQGKKKEKLYIYLNF